MIRSGSIAQKRAMARLNARRESRAIAEASESTTLFQWMRRYRSMLSPTVKFDLTSRPYLHPLYHMKEWPKSLCVRKGAQIGITEWLFSVACFQASEWGSTVLYVFPNDTLITAFSSSRFGESIMGSAKFESLFVSGSKAGGVNTVKTKRLGSKGGALLLRGGRLDKDGKNPGLLSVSANSLIIDEVNATGSADRVISMGKKRLLAAINPLQLYASTPTHEGIGISKLYKESSQNEWYVRCSGPKAHRQTFGIENVVHSWNELKQPTGWHTDAHGRPQIRCSWCEHPIARAEILAGQWEALHPDREKIGYYIHGLMGSLDLGDVIEELGHDDQGVVAECWNQSLGREFSPKGTAVDDATFDSRKDNFSMNTPIECDAYYMGVDVGNFFNVVIIGKWSAKGSADNPAEVPEYFPIVWVGKTRDEDEVRAIWRRFKPARTVIDANPERRTVEGIQKDLDFSSIYLCLYQKVDGKNPISIDYRDGYVKADRTRMLDLTYAKFFNKADGWLVPGDIDSEPDFREHIKNNKRVVIKNRSGEDVASWQESGPDHYSHALNYATIAAEIGGMLDFGGDGMGRIGKEKEEPRQAGMGVIKGLPSQGEN